MFLLLKELKKYTMTLEELLNVYAENEIKRGSFALGTRNNYLSVIRMLQTMDIIHQKVMRIETKDLQILFDDLGNGFYREDHTFHKPYSKSRICAYSALLTNAFAYAVYPLKIIKQNPMEHIALPVTRNETKIFSDMNHKEQVLSHESFLKIIDYLNSKDSPNALPIQIAYYTGLRLGEVCGLTWEDIHFDEQFLIVQRSVVLNCENKNRLEFTTPKRDKSRIVYFPNTLKTILKEEKKKQKNIVCRNYYMEIQENGTLHYPLYSGVIDNKDKIAIHLVCIKKDGSYINRRSLACSCTRLNKHIDGLQDFHFHMLRHTYATNLLATGMDMQEVKELLGHNDIRTTMNIYVHNNEETMLKRIRKLDKIINS